MKKNPGLSEGQHHLKKQKRYYQATTEQENEIFEKLVRYSPVRVDEKSGSIGKKPEQKERGRVWPNRNFRSRKRVQRANYYTNRKVLTLPVIKFPDLELNENWEENLRIALDELRLKGKVKKEKRPKEREAAKNPPRLKLNPGSEAEVERLKRDRMEGKSGNSSGQGKFSKNDDHQSVAVNVRERKFPDDKKRVCSSAECKTFLGEANRNRKSKDLNSEKSDTLKPETTQKYLQDSYNNAFQRHVDNLTNVISQHRNSTSTEKPKTEVHIHPTSESSKNLRNIAPVSKLEIKSEAGINQNITFARVEDNEEEFEDFSKMKQIKNLKKINQFTEDLEGEEDLFEELIEPNPMITFNHVCSEAESDQVNFNQIKSGSRSSSPMLEVPNSKSGSQKMTSRPPL